nr:triple gene block 3 [Grapevine carlavirus 1]
MFDVRVLIVSVLAFCITYYLLDNKIGAQQKCVIKISGESALLEHCPPEREIAEIVRALGEALRLP